MASYEICIQRLAYAYGYRINPDALTDSRLTDD